MSTSSPARIRIQPNVAAAAKRRRTLKREPLQVAAVTSTGCTASTPDLTQPVDQKPGSVDVQACAVCNDVVADGALADSAFGVVCGECGALADTHNGSVSLLVHDTHEWTGEGASAIGQRVSLSLGARGFGVTSQLRGDTSRLNRSISARRRVHQHLSLLLTHLRLSTPAMRAAVQALVETVVGGRYGDGSSRWLELVCIACVCVAHRQHQTLTPTAAVRQVLLNSELAAIVAMDEALIIRMVARIQRQHVKPPAAAPLTGAEYLPRLMAAVQWRDGDCVTDLLCRQHAVQQKTQQLLRVAHRLDLQHGHSALTLSAAALTVVLLHPPHCQHHSHAVRLVSSLPSSPSLLAALSARAGVSTRVLRQHQTSLESAVTRLVLPLLPHCPPATPLPRKRKSGQMEGEGGSSAPLVSLLLQQLDVVDACCTAPLAGSQVADSGEAVEVKVEAEPDCATWADEAEGFDQELSQYIRTEEEIADLQRLEQT